MSNAGLQPEAADPGDRSWPRRALPLVWLGFSLKDFAPPALTQGTALALSWEADHWMGAGHRHPKFCEARDTIVTMKPEDDEEGAMGDVECGQNAVHQSKGASVPMAPDTARRSHPGVLERTAALIERVRAEYLFLAVALPWGLALVFLVPPFRVFDEPMHYEWAWSVADGQMLSAPDGTVRVPTNVAALFDVAMATKPRDPPHLLPQSISRTSARVYTSAAGYGPIGYLPQAIGIDAVRLIKGSPLAAFYAGRTANLLASLLLIVLAVRLLLFGKRVVGARVVDHDDGRHPCWDAANGPQGVREPGSRRTTVRGGKQDSR